MGAAGDVAGECSQAVKESFQQHALHRDSGLVDYQLRHFFGYLSGTMDQTLLSMLCTT